ncbi:MAG: hypothetical protein JXR25_00320 [Pontiellaceae bacterium]|nr:hypothetical protein [Pontiellaceae bacterium]MBN2783243.1 hypothetical protein [Pontiellaceae bacterium]
MDVGTFKASGARLTAWLVIPPVLIVVCGVGGALLERRAHWETARIEALSEALPQLVDARMNAQLLLEHFKETGGSIQSEEQLIAFLRETAVHAGFSVDTLKVDREVAGKGRNTDTLAASVKGTGTLAVIQQFMRDVGASQDLLSDDAIKLTQAHVDESGEYRAELSFELLLFNAAGGAK